MSTEKKSALEQLKEFQTKEESHLSSLEINEPDLKGFDAASVFEIQSEPSHKIFKKRASRHVTIHPTAFDNETAKMDEIKLEEPKPVLKRSARNQPVQEEQPVEEPVLEETKVEMEVETPVLEAEVEAPVLEAQTIEQIDVEVEKEPQTIEEVEEPSVDLEPEEEIVKVVEEEEETEEEEEDEIETSLEESTQYDEDDLYVEKKRFLLSQYDKEEEYLEENSKNGFHYVRNVGKKYYFVKEEPRNYYYSICYFSVEPSSYEWRKWEADGWKLVARVPGHKKNAAGWFVFRNELQQDDLKKEIENEEEKFKYFKRYSNSCRSTMFLFFICMAICGMAAYLQYLFNGFLAIIIACGVLFLLSFIFFCMYGRMLRSSSKKARLLKAKVRVRERQNAFNNEGVFAPTETEEELNTDWNTLENEKEKPKKRRRGRK